jgi:hypothetical protein
MPCAGWPANRTVKHYRALGIAVELLATVDLGPEIYGRASASHAMEISLDVVRDEGASARADERA